MKSAFKSLIVAILGWQLRRLNKKNQFTVIGVVGSLGKTSTKRAVAEILSKKYRVQYQAGNYNDLVTVPLIFFGLDLPSLLNPFAWARILINIEKQLSKKYRYDIVIVELGIDGPGQMIEFARYLKLDYCLVTAIAPEHMEFFDGIEGVAKEELSAGNFTDKLIVNGDLCPTNLTGSAKIYKTYGVENNKSVFSKLPIQSWRVNFGPDSIDIKNSAISEARVYSLSAAAVVAHELGMSAKEIQDNLKNISPAPGRMNLLKGKNGSTLIDDSYNASPKAMIMALDTIYNYNAKQKIALLGNMNELGKFSKNLHQEIGDYCDPEKLDLVVTLGPDSNEYLAAVAEQKGCKVVRTDTPYQAAEVIEKELDKDTAVLIKGSQNKVFAEEATKLLLANKEDSKQLVRQSADWLAKKKKAF